MRFIEYHWKEKKKIQIKNKASIKEESSNEKKNEEGITSLCLMTHNDDVNIKNSSKFIFEELLDVFYELMDEYKRIRLKNKELKKSNLILTEEKNKLLIEKEEFLKEKKVLVERNFFFEIWKISYVRKYWS